MKLVKPSKRKELETQGKLKKRYHGFEQLINELGERELSESIIGILNNEIEALNSIPNSDKQFTRVLRKKKSLILKTLEKELKLVPKHHYRTLWMAIGMSVFGIPMGAAFGAALDNMGFLGIGLPIGMAIGIGVGTAMDEKARKEGRQLNVVHEF
jgi:hypothetical protein